MKVKLISSMVSHKRAFKIGEELELPADEAQRLIDGGAAVAVAAGSVAAETEAQKLRVENAQLRAALGKEGKGQRTQD